MKNQDVTQILYDRLNALTRNENEGIEVDVYGESGIVFKPANFAGISSWTMNKIVKHFNGKMFQPEGLVLYDSKLL